MLSFHPSEGGGVGEGWGDEPAGASFPLLSALRLARLTKFDPTSFLKPEILDKVVFGVFRFSPITKQIPWGLSVDTEKPRP